MRICAATVTLVLGLMGSAMAADLYVATNGSDAWSGRLAGPNAERTDGPFATVARARDAVRQIKAGEPLRAPVQVVIRGGTYLLNEPFQLGPADSGTAEFPITYAAYPGEKPVLSGGRRLTGWRPYRDRIWSCSLKDLGLQGLRPRQLFYRGERQVIARWPNRDPKRPRTGGFLYTEEQRTDAQIRFRAGAFPRRWSRPTEVEVVIFPNYAWGNPSVPVAKFDADQRLITLSRKVGEIWRGDRFYVQNALEELDAPGEWHLDRQAETVYFWPPDDGLPTEGAVVPALQNLVVLQGDFAKQRFVERVNISHIALECCEKDGVTLGAARQCGIIGCALRQVGGAGVVIGAASRSCRVAGNDIAHPGGHAIAMYYDTGSPDVCTDNVITNNYAHHCGDVTVCSFGWGSGICISGLRNVASHNLVHDTAYNAFNFDGYDNVIEYNRFHHSSLECDDCGGIYGWVNTRHGSGRNIIRFNRVHDCVGYGKPRGELGRYQSPYFSWGIYLDDYLSDTTVYGNLVYRAWRGCLHLHGGWNNTVENNVFAEGYDSQVTMSNMSRTKPSLSGITGKSTGAPGTGEWSMSGIILRRNILYCAKNVSAPSAGRLAGLWGKNTAEGKPYQASHFEDGVLKEADWNVIWRRGLPVEVGFLNVGPEDSWRAWQAAGRDMHSLVTDPMFVDPERDDYRLRPESPALKLGFKPLPIEQMGLIASPERASWPVVEEETMREPPIPLPPPPPAPGVQIGRAYRLAAPIRIDGKLDGDEWDGADKAAPLVVERLADGTEATSMFLPDRQAGQPALRLAGLPAYRAKTPPKATAQVRFDEGNLYVATVCPWNKPTQVEVFLQAIKEDKPGEAFVVRGDSSGRLEAAGKAVTYAVSGGDGRWTMEWRIPFALNATTKTRFNVRVRQEGDRDWIAWAASDPGYLVSEPPVPADAKNLAANGDFEAGTDKPNDWSVVERITGELPAGAKKAVGLWVNQGREGSRCLKLEAADPNAMKVCETWWAQSFPAPPAGTYIMTYEIRARDIVPRRENGKVYASGWAQWKKGGQTQGMNLGWGPENHIARGSAPCWTRRECVFNVSGQAETIYLLFGIEHATGTVWIDNVKLEKCQ